MSWRQRSLYARLALALLLVLALAGSGLVVAAWSYARIAADEAYDQVLVGGALQIAENTWMNNGVLSVDVPLSAFSVLSAHDRVFYKVMDPARRVVAGDPALQVDVPWEALRRGPVLRSARFQGEAVRVAIVGRHVVEDDPDGWAVIVLAETQVARRALAGSLTTKALAIVALMGLITIAAAMLAAQRALKPLRDIAAAIRARDAASRDPLRVDAPTEAEVLVQTINEFIDRLNARIALMRRVVGDVSHQIRTPLAAVASQVELWEHAETEQARRAQAERIKQRLKDVGELSNQMLSHAMVLHRSDSASFEEVDLVALVRQQLLQQLEDRHEVELEVSFESPEEGLAVVGDTVMLKEALRNVLANALAYGVRRRLAVSVRRAEHHAEVAVEDDGPGIDEALWPALRTPFTPRPSGREGTSLGLAIVDEVMRAHGGALRFERPADGGFRVVLSLPVAG